MLVVGCTPSTRGNILSSCHLNHFRVQPEILYVFTPSTRGQVCGLYPFLILNDHIQALTAVQPTTNIFRRILFPFHFQ